MIDILRTAKLLIQHHSDQEATVHAAMRADELLGKGDLEGAAVWRRVIKAIELLSAEVLPGADEVVNGRNRFEGANQMKVEPMLDPKRQSLLMEVASDLIEGANATVSQYAHELSKATALKGMAKEEIYEHLWLAFIAFSEARARGRGHGEALDDWREVVG